MKDNLHSLDIVALMKNQIGTIVEVLVDGVYEVEFADAKGRTLTTCAIKAKDLLKLTHELAT